jgi:signal transduction histidine kinase
MNIPITGTVFPCHVPAAAFGAGEPWTDAAPARSHGAPHAPSHPPESAQPDERERLESIVLMKDRFLALVTHELRTPLTPILMLSELMMTETGLGADMREAVETIHTNAVLATRLVSDLLDLSRMNYGKLQLRMEPVDVHAVILHAESTVRFDADARAVSLDAALGATSHTVCGDVDRLSQIVLNLLTNAVKFTPAGGAVVIRTSNPTAGTLAISVVDNGIGIGQDLLTRLFDPFFQAPQERAASQHGLGLGLAITRMLVEAHGGGIRAESAGPDRGATFEVVLPVV